MRNILRLTVLFLFINAVGFAQKANPPAPPCSTCVSGGGSAGSVPVFSSSSTQGRGVLEESTLSQGGGGTINFGPIVDGQPTGAVNAKSGWFVGDLGGVLGRDTHIDPDIAVWGVIGLNDNTEGGGVFGRANAPEGGAEVEVRWPRSALAVARQSG